MTANISTCRCGATLAEVNESGKALCENCGQTTYFGEVPSYKATLAIPIDEGFDCSRFESGSWLYRLTVTAVLVAFSLAVAALAIIGLSNVQSWIGGAL